MKSLYDLSKDELLSIIANNTDLSIFSHVAECSVCGDNSEAKYYYICDNCENTLNTSFYGDDC